MGVTVVATINKQIGRDRPAQTYTYYLLDDGDGGK